MILDLAESLLVRIAIYFIIDNKTLSSEMASSKRKADDVPVEINSEDDSDADDEAGDGEFNENKKTRITKSSAHDEYTQVK